MKYVSFASGLVCAIVFFVVYTNIGPYTIVSRETIEKSKTQVITESMLKNCNQKHKLILGYNRSTKAPKEVYTDYHHVVIIVNTEKMYDKLVNITHEMRRNDN